MLKIEYQYEDKDVILTMTNNYKDATWLELMDTMTTLLKAAGYRLSKDKLIKWAEEHDVDEY
jgi:hypothetical protein